MHFGGGGGWESRRQQRSHHPEFGAHGSWEHDAIPFHGAPPISPRWARDCAEEQPGGADSAGAGSSGAVAFDGQRDYDGYAPASYHDVGDPGGNDAANAVLLRTEGGGGAGGRNHAVEYPSHAVLPPRDDGEWELFGGTETVQVGRDGLRSRAVAEPPEAGRGTPSVPLAAASPPPEPAEAADDSPGADENAAANANDAGAGGDHGACWTCGSCGVDDNAEAECLVRWPVP